MKMRRLANSGPIIEVRTAQNEGKVYHRSRKTAEQFAACLPHNMNPEKRARIMAANFPKG